ncbi:MAG: hypothetical protein IPP71_09440 [Bacteroidetes bacterium]|nr:hypothetical protein [Bacteroidota bacterium]
MQLKTYIKFDIFLMLITAILFSCCQPSSELQNAGSTKGQKLSGKNKEKTYTVSGKVQQTFSYCGGARPSEEMLEKLATPSSYPGKKFYIRKGQINSLQEEIVAEFVSDTNGLFSIHMEPGTYSIILQEQVSKIKVEDYANKNQKIDEKCLNEWWGKPYIVLVVMDQNINDLNFIFRHRCFITNDIPCITYTGPLPP